ncbi:right-handed parallel beta-helix repeat-containing protein [sulfur-oxidizing endosymbiont of Gigantopelta aegis]|uniref:right-handed parallel beta-helix repeat-containing protein n=1 Tax=sulfur-oxidizing endosymbiont of Gigantopelta aegis TaxID=2794934 RepID=UPI0018DC7F7A|nr:right-handed parallel beta-helix repeat-containing protein [sulfur-oxidizing endosymbiont of Gigantopelta aegis]
MLLESSGTLDKPITLQAAPGHEGKVIVDGQGTNTLFFIGDRDYIVIQNLHIINAYSQAIGSRGKSARIYDDANSSIGVHILNNYIFNTNSNTAGANIAAIRLDHSKDWVIRNNTIDRITQNGILAKANHTSGIQAYEYNNILIENNKITNVSSGILWKDHNVISDDGSGSIIYHNGSEIRFNIIAEASNAISLITNRSGGDEAANHFVHHNIFYNISTAGIHINMSDSLFSSTNFRIEHNIFDNVSLGVTNDSFKQSSFLGNIFVNCLKSCIDFKDETDIDAQLVASDYNVFDNTFKVSIDRYGISQRSFKTLTDWQAAKTIDFVALSFDFPDSNSIISSADLLFMDSVNRDYHYKNTSPAKSLLADASNAGPYQLGTELIGLLPDYPSYDVPIKNNLSDNIKYRRSSIIWLLLKNE